MPEINQDGLVALKHYNSNPATVIVSGTAYSFVPRLSISFAWVQPEHVDQLLGIKAPICCGQSKNKFLYANELDVCLWETGKRCGEE